MASAVEPPHKRARTEGEITPSPCGLPEEIWGNILSRLLPGPDVFKVRRVCHTFQRLTLPAILEYLSRQETMKADDFTQFHLPLFYLLIYQNSAFKVEKNSHPDVPQTELHDLWRDFSVPHIFSYALQACKSAKELDLRDSRYSIMTFIGQYIDFEREVATLDFDSSPVCTSQRQIEPVVSGITEIFQQNFSYPLVLPKVEILKIKAPNLSEDETLVLWTNLTGIFPSLQMLEIIGGIYTREQLDEIKEYFPKLKECKIEAVQFGP